MTSWLVIALAWVPIAALVLVFLFEFKYYRQGRKAARKLRGRHDQFMLYVEAATRCPYSIKTDYRKHTAWVRGFEWEILS